MSADAHEVVELLDQVIVDHAVCRAPVDRPQDLQQVVPVDLGEGRLHGLCAKPILGRCVGERPPRRQSQLLEEAPSHADEERVERPHVHLMQIGEQPSQQRPALGRIGEAWVRVATEFAGPVGIGRALSQANQDPVQDLAGRLARERRREDLARRHTRGQQLDDAARQVVRLARSGRSQDQLTRERRG